MKQLLECIKQAAIEIPNAAILAADQMFPREEDGPSPLDQAVDLVHEAFHDLPTDDSTQYLFESITSLADHREALLNAQRSGDANMVAMSVASLTAASSYVCMAVDELIGSLTEDREETVEHPSYSPQMLQGLCHSVLGLPTSLNNREVLADATRHAQSDGPHDPLEPKDEKDGNRDDLRAPAADEGCRFIVSWSQVPVLDLTDESACAVLGAMLTQFKGLITTLFDEYEIREKIDRANVRLPPIARKAAVGLLTSDLQDLIRTRTELVPAVFEAVSGGAVSLVRKDVRGAVSDAIDELLRAATAQDGNANGETNPDVHAISPVLDLGIDALREELRRRRARKKNGSKHSQKHKTVVQRSGPSADRSNQSDRFSRKGLKGGKTKRVNEAMRETRRACEVGGGAIHFSRHCSYEPSLREAEGLCIGSSARSKAGTVVSRKKKPSY